MSSKRSLLITGLILGVVVAVSACVLSSPQASFPPAAPPLTTVRVAYFPTISYGPLFIAQDEGYFARQGITVDFEKIPGGSVALPSLINGDIAVSSGNIEPSVINAIARGAHVRVVADKGHNAPGNSCNVSGVMVRRDLYDSRALTAIPDLNGRRIMIPAGDDYTLHRILHAGNLSTADVEIVTLDFPSAFAALQNGAVDAAVLSEPFVTEAEDSGAAVMLLPAETYTPDIPHPLYYGPAFLDRDPDLGRRFMIAYLQGVRQYNLGKTERNTRIISNYTHIDPDLLQRTCWMPVSPDGSMSRQPFHDQIGWLYANNQITFLPGDDQVFDTSYTEYANRVLANTSG